MPISGRLGLAYVRSKCFDVDSLNIISEIPWEGCAATNIKDKPVVHVAD